MFKYALNDSLYIAVPPCEHEQMNRKPMVEIALRRVVPQIGVTWLKANNYTHGTVIIADFKITYVNISIYITFHCSVSK